MERSSRLVLMLILLSLLFLGSPAVGQPPVASPKGAAPSEGAPSEASQGTVPSEAAPGEASKEVAPSERAPGESPKEAAPKETASEGTKGTSSQEENPWGALLWEMDHLLAQHPEPSEGVVFLRVLLKDLDRFDKGQMSEVILLDPAASELDGVSRLESEGLSLEAAWLVSGRFKGLRFQILELYQKVSRGGKKEELTQRLRKELKARLSILEEEALARHKELNLQSQTHWEEVQDRRSEGAQRD